MYITRKKSAEAAKQSVFAFEAANAGSRLPVTAAEAIERMESWFDLTPQKRREFTSALNTCSRVAGVPTTALLLTPKYLRSNVVTKSPAIWDMAPVSKSNVLSRLRYVLGRLGIIDPPIDILSPDWIKLHDLAEKRARMSLVTIMKYFTSISVAPGEVAASHLDDFETWLTTRTICPEPRSIVTGARRAWNKMSTSVDLWPKTILSMKSNRSQLLLPFSACPASFGEDVEAYKEKLNGQDVDQFFGVSIDAEDGDPNAFDEIAAEKRKGAGRNGGAQILRPLTISSKLQSIKVAFNALHRAGVPLSEIRSLSCLVTPLDHPKMIINQLLRENGGFTKPFIAHATETLRQLAKFHGKCSPKDVAQLARRTKRVRVDYHEMTSRNRKKLAEICTPERLRTLRNMPDALMAQAEELGPTFRGAVAARRAAMLILLTRAPMRLGNLMTLRLNEHLIRSDPKSGRMSAIVIDAEDTKNTLSLTYPLSQATSAILERWITEFRPLLTTPNNPYLFGGEGIEPMTRAGMRDSVKAITLECLGVAINPHLFRHIAAAIFLEACPGGFEDLRRLLGHKTLQTTTRAYIRIENDASVTKFDKILDEMEETMGVKPKLPKKRPLKPKVSVKPQKSGATVSSAMGHPEKKAPRS